MGCASSKKAESGVAAPHHKDTPNAAYYPAVNEPVTQTYYAGQQIDNHGQQYPPVPSAPPMMPTAPPSVYPPPYGAPQPQYPHPGQQQPQYHQPAPQAPPMANTAGMGQYMDPDAIPSAQAAAINNTPPAAKLRRLMHVDPVNRVGWMAEARTRTGVEDYTYTRDSAHTGDLLDDRGDPIGKVFDITPHKADAKTGMRLSGPNVFGKYKPVDGGEVTLGIFELDARKLKVSGTACSVAIRLVYTGTCVEDSHVFHMGSGWADHFTIVHGRGFLKFVTTPNNASGAWNNRVEVVSTFRDKDFEPGKAYTLVAVLTNEGRMLLYVDGELDVEGPGLASLPEFEVSTDRENAWCGRFMRPDTSMPVRAGIVSVEVFDGELDAESIRQHYSVRNVYTNIRGGYNPPGHAGQQAPGGPGVTSWSPGGATVAGAAVGAGAAVAVANWDTVGPVAGGFAASAGDGVVAGGNAVADWAPGAASGAGDFAGNAAGAVAGFFS